MDSEQQAGILILDDALSVRLWDPWLARVTGISADEARGKPRASLFPDLESRGMMRRLRRVVREGSSEVMAPALHKYLLRCPPQTPSAHFDAMQQHVVVAPLSDGEAVVGAIVTIEDVTERLEREKNGPDLQSAAAPSPNSQGVGPRGSGITDTLVGAFDDGDWRLRRAAVHALAGDTGREAIGRLVLALRTQFDNASVLNSALQALALLDVDVVTPLGDLLQAPEADVRSYAASTATRAG